MGSTSATREPAGSGVSGVLAMALASFGFSWGFIIVKAVGLSPSHVAFYRLLLGAGLLAGIALVRRARWHLSGAVIAAGVCFGLHQLLFITASQTTAIALVTLVQTLQPLLVALVSRRTVGERVPPLLLGCAVAALFGVGLVIYANRALPSTNLYAVSLCVLNLVTFAASFLFSKRARLEGAPTLTLTAATLSVAWVLVAPVSALAVEPALPAWWELGLLAVLSWIPGNGHILVNWAHTRISATLGSIVLTLVPVFASIWAHLIFGEPYGPLHVAGTLLTLAAVVLGRRAAPI